MRHIKDLAVVCLLIACIAMAILLRMPGAPDHRAAMATKPVPSSVDGNPISLEQYLQALADKHGEQVEDIVDLTTLAQPEDSARPQP